MAGNNTDETGHLRTAIAREVLIVMIAGLPPRPDGPEMNVGTLVRLAVTVTDTLLEALDTDEAA